MTQTRKHRDIDLLEACGGAVGFALAAASKEGAVLGTREGLTAFARNLHTLCENERFSEDVNFVVGGIVTGLLAWLNIDTDADVWL